jgi:hypothetical protein
MTRHGALTTLSANAGDSLKDHSSDRDMIGDDSSSDAAGFWSVAISVLAMAVEDGKPGAMDARARVIAASNYDPNGHGASNNPTWAVVPR